MIERRGVIAVVVGVALVGGGLGWWLLRAGETSQSTARSASDSPRLDAEKYRADIRKRLERARKVDDRRKRAQAAALAMSGDAGPNRPKSERPSSMKGMSRDLMEPRCILGPAELCAAIDDSAIACDDGDGQACLAVGQYLADTPPRPLIALSFFLYACKSGAEEGCARMKDIKEGPVRPCEEDIFGCAWKGYRGKDSDRLDDACSLGVADACAWLENHYKDDPARARGYLETSCQLGNPMACNELVQRLTAGCKPDPEVGRTCYPPDPAEAEEARTIACEAGFEEACT